MNIIEVKNLNFSYSNVHIIKSLNLKIENKSWTCIVGKNSCGRSTLLKLFGGYIITDNEIIIDDIYINKLNSEIINKKVEYLFSSNNFFCKTVLDELITVLDCDDIVKRSTIKNILKTYDMLPLMNTSPLTLNSYEQLKLALIKIFLKKPKVIFLDNPFSNINIKEKKQLIDMVKNFSNENNISVISAINDLSDYMYYDRILVLQNKNIILDGTPELVFKQEEILNKIGIRLPFEYELSKKLKMYDLVNEDFFDMEELVKELC